MRAFTVALMMAGALTTPALAHGGGLNACGCHFNTTTGECHCHQPTGCGCECEPAFCADLRGGNPLRREPEAALGPAPEGALAQEVLGDVEPLAGGCGVERWKVKTLSDPAGRGLHRHTPRPATVEELVSLPAPAPRRSR